MFRLTTISSVLCYSVPILSYSFRLQQRLKMLKLFFFCNVYSFINVSQDFTLCTPSLIAVIFFCILFFKSSFNYSSNNVDCICIIFSLHKARLFISYFSSDCVSHLYHDDSYKCSGDMTQIKTGRSTKITLCCPCFLRQCYKHEFGDVC